MCFFFFSSRRRHTRSDRDWSSDVCSSDLLRRKDGAFVEVEMSSNALPDGRLQALVRDITARIEAAEKLAEAKYSSVVSISADCVISIDDEERITLFNAAAERTFGY